MRNVKYPISASKTSAPSKIDRRGTNFGGARLAAACAAVLLAGIGTSQAAGLVHSLSSTDTTNWSADTWSNGVPDSTSAGDVASYINSLLATTTLDINVTVGSITNGGAGAWNIATDGSSTLTLDNTGGTGNATITTTSSGNLTIAPNVVIKNTNLDINSGTATGTITLTGTITGTGNLNLLGNRNATVITLGTAGGTDMVNNTGALVAKATGTGGTPTIFQINGGIGVNVTSITVGDDGNPSFLSRLNVAGTSHFKGPINILGGGNLAGSTASLNMSDTTNGITFGTGGGTLTATSGGGGITTAKAITLNGTASINNLATDPITFSGLVTGAGGITKITNTGTFTLSNPNNSFTGPLAIQSGTVSINSIKNVGSVSAIGAPTTAANGTIKLGAAATSGVLAYTGAGDTTNRVIDLAGTTGGGALDSSGAGPLVFTSNFTASGAGSKVLTLQGSNAQANTIAGSIVNNSATNTTGLTKTGSGFWALTGTSTYTGPTTVFQGTLEVDGALGATTVTIGGGTLRLTNPNALTSAILTNSSTVAGVLQLRADDNEFFATSGFTIAGNLTINSDQATSLGFSNTLALGSTTLGQAIATFTAGNGYNTFLGPVTLTGATSGTLAVNSGNLTVASITGSTAATQTIELGGSSNGTVNGAVSDGASTVVSILKSGTGEWTVNGDTNFTGSITITGGGTLVLGNGGSAGALPTGNVTLTSGTLAFDYSSAFTVGNTITGAGGLALSGGGIMTLSSAANTFSGGIFLIGSTLVAGNANPGVLGSGTITFGSAANLDLNGNSVTTGLLGTNGSSDDGTITSSVSGVPVTLTISGTSTTASFGGAISDGPGGSILSLVKANTGIQTLTGASSYSGVTTVSAGTLNIQNNLALGSTAGGTVVASGATLQLQGGITVTGEALSVTTNGTAFSLQSVSGDNTWAGPITIAPGANTRIDSDAGTLTITGNITETTSATGDNLVLQGNGNVLILGAISGVGGVTRSVTGTGTDTLAGANTYTGATSISSSVLTITGTLGNTAVSVASIGTLNLNNANAVSQNTLSTAGTVTENVNNALSGTAKLTVTGGTTTLSNSNNYTGATTLSAGTLNLQAAGAISASALTYSGGTLNISVPNGLSGSSSLSVTGSTLTLSIANNYTGGTTLGGGTLNLALGSAIGTGPLAINTGTLLASSAPVTINNPVTIGGAAPTIGAGTNITFGNSGSVTVKTNSTVSVNNNTTFAGNVYLSDAAATGRSLTLAGSGAVTISGAIANFNGSAGTASSFGYSGAGSLTLSGANTFTGSTTLNSAGGTLNVTAASKLGAGSLTVSNSSTGAGTTTTLNLNSAQSVGSLIGTVATPTSGTNAAVINLNSSNAILSVTQLSATTFAGTLAGVGGLSVLKPVAASSILTLTGTNSYTGATVVGGGLTLSGNGSDLGTSGITITGGTLAEDNTATVLADNGTSSFGRIGNTTGIKLQNGTFAITGNITSALSSQETVGTVTLDSGMNTITLTQGVATNTSNTLSASALVRNNNAVALVRGSTLGQSAAGTNSTFFNLGTAPSAAAGTLIGGAGTFGTSSTKIAIVPFLVGDSSASGPGSTFVGYDPVNGLRALATSEFLNTLSGAGSDDNVRLASGATTVTLTGTTVNSLIIDSIGASGVVNANLTNTLTLNSGALLLNTMTHSMVLAGGTLQFAASNSSTTRQEGIISNPTGFSATINSTIIGSGGMTFASSASNGIFLGSTANSWTGQTTIDGILNLNVSNVLPDGSAVVIAQGGTLNENVVANQTETIASLAGTGTVNLGASGGATLITGGDNTSTTYSGVITGASGKFTKQGTGIQTLSGASTYTGLTTVNAGALIVSGSLSGTAGISVADGATFGGTGTITVASGGQVSISGGTTGGTLAPGNLGVGNTSQPGILTITDPGTPALGGTLSLAATSHLSLQLGGTTAGTQYDQIVVNGTVSLAGDATISLFNDYTPTIGDKLYLIINDGSDAIAGTFSSINGQSATDGSTIAIGGSFFTITYAADSSTNSFAGGNDVALLAVIPEPSSAALLGASFVMTAGLQRLRRRNH